MRAAGQRAERRDVRRAAAGDLAAFERLYRRYSARVFSLSRRMLGSVDRAEDATQEVFLRAWRKLPSFRHEAPFGAWLARLARNHLLNELRWRERHEPEVQSAAAEDLDELPPAADAGTTAAGGRGPEEELALESAVGSLPEGSRQVLVLYHFEGLTHAEIAGALGISVGTSKSQLHRARSLLRSALESP